MPQPNGPRAPYSMEPVTFPFPALAAMGGRAALGGPREISLASLVVGRLVADACDRVSPLPLEIRRARIGGARHWLGAASLPAQVRTALVKLAEATGTDDRAAILAALESVTAITANSLDSGARLELSKLAQAVAE